MTLGVLPPYRSCGIGTKLLTTTLQEAEEDNSIEEVYLHVQTSNTDALEFYKRFGFEQKEKICNYYKRIDPPDCYLMVKRFSGGKCA
jgi:ribosomal protein S18 acetylase RimI-like enzyme